MIDNVKDKIKRFPLGYVFTIDNFRAEVGSPKTASKIISTLVEEGLLRRLAKGRFYRPQITELGELPPDIHQTAKDLLKDNRKIIGYTTGYAIFNELGLTTQVSSVLQIGTRKEQKNLTRGGYRIYFVKQENVITKANIPLLRLLDCLRFFKKIPDTTPDAACRRLLYLFSRLETEQTVRIKRLALKYNPATIALLGAMLEMINPKENTTALFKKLNFITGYKFGISPEALPTQRKWNIR
jgi:hypothetical protein